MGILEVLTWPNPVLKAKAKVVKREDVTAPEMQKLVEDMLETMYAAPGIGLAAPQVGKSIRMVVIDTRPTDEKNKTIEEEMTELERQVKYPVVIFNPEIVKKVGKTTYEEGCLSVPGFTETVNRSEYVEVQGMDASGQDILIKSDGLLGICLQHELDHLDGKLFIDRLSLIKSEMIKSKIRKSGYPDERSSSQL